MMNWEVAGLPVVFEGSTDRVCILAHGAGSRMDSPTIVRLSDTLRGVGMGVVRFDFGYRVAGRSFPDRMPALVLEYRAVIVSVQERLSPEKLILSGHSMGGRAASVTAAEFDSPPFDLILLSYPLHPEGKPEKIRDAHLEKIRGRVLCINGDHDPLCDQDLMEATLAGLDHQRWTMHWLHDVDHGYRPIRASDRSQASVFEEIGQAVVAFVPLGED